MAQQQMLCVIVEQKAADAELSLVSIDRTAVDGEIEFQIVRLQSSASRSRPTYHIHFTRPLVPSHDRAIEEEGVKFGLDPNDLRRICAIVLQIMPDEKDDTVESHDAPSSRVH